MTKETFEDILRKYRTYITDTTAAEEAMYFVKSLLETEAVTLELTDPDAYNSIRRLRNAASEVGMLIWELADQNLI